MTKHKTNVKHSIQHHYGLYIRSLPMDHHMETGYA